MELGQLAPQHIPWLVLIGCVQSGVMEAKDSLFRLGRLGYVHIEDYLIYSSWNP